MKKYKIVILWDWDNTLVDTFEAIWKAQNDMRIHYGLEPWSKKEAKNAMNTSGRNLIKNLVGEDKATEARAFYLDRYAVHAQSIQLKDGALDLLNFAKQNGFCCVLASNKAGTILKSEVSRQMPLDTFDLIIGAEEAPEDKPSKVFTDKALENFTYDCVVSIGDGASDIKMGHNYKNGISILVFSDPTSSEFKDNVPDYACATLNDVKNILQNVITQKELTRHLTQSNCR